MLNGTRLSEAEEELSMAIKKCQEIERWGRKKAPAKVQKPSKTRFLDVFSGSVLVFFCV